ncbi:MAG: DUF4232 domain-containing protein [Actinobacteria bacterium]|nr:DUF4232 domain-containing protein [Actinomycetota bacterium]
MSRSCRRVAGLAIAVTSLLAVAACDSSGTEGSGPAGGTATVTGSGESTASGSTATASGTPTVDQIGPCGNGALHASVGEPQRAAGHGSAVIKFVNELGEPCTVSGYPGFDANPDGGEPVHASRSLSGYSGGAKAITTLTVKPDQAVSATVEWLDTDTDGSDCDTSDSVSVTAPNTGTTQKFPLEVGLCGLQIHPVVAGTTGRG